MEFKSISQQSDNITPEIAEAAAAAKTPAPPAVVVDPEVGILALTESKCLANVKDLEEVVSFVHDVFKEDSTITEGAEVELTEVITDKLARGKLHQLVRQYFGSRITTKTDLDTKLISLRRSSHKERRIDLKRSNKEGKPKAKRVKHPNFLEFTLYKVNMDTNHCLNQVC